MGEEMLDFDGTKLTFEQALTELERIVHELEDGKTGLEDALARYEEGVGLLRRCYGQLRQAEQRIVELLGVDGDGQVLVKPFDHTAKMEAARTSAERTTASGR
jgi:exodeoxyribonuclease VII small subunit